MTDIRPEDLGLTSTVEVRVYRSGDLVTTELCETAAEAAAHVAVWEEQPGITCEVRDLTVTMRDGSDMEVDPADLSDVYPYGDDPTA